MLEKIEAKREGVKGRQRMRLLDSITGSMDLYKSEQTPGDCEGQWSLACYSPWGCKVRHDLATEQQQELT